MPLGKIDRSAQRAHQETTQHFKILNPLAQLDANATVAEVLQEIDNLTATASKDPKALSLHLWETWWALLEIVARTPRTQQSKLVEFMAQLQKKTLTDPTTGEPLKSSDLNMWAQLPTFSWALRDGWNTSEYYLASVRVLYLLTKAIDVWDPDLTADDKQRWDNRNAFLAQLTAAAEVDYTNDWHHPMDFSVFGLWAFGAAFEKEAPADVSADTAGRAACWWFIYAADRLWANVENGRTWEGKIGSGLGKYEDKPWTGYNRERWGVWEERLVAAKATASDEDTKKLIEDALAHIERVSA
jgi:hypothetical protein